MSTIFTKIIAREIPAAIVAEDDWCIAFLDSMPLVEGHTLIVPKQEINYLFDVDDTTLQHLIIFAKRISKSIRKAIPCQRIGMSVIGLEVPHAHIHLVPIFSAHDLNFTRPKLNPTFSELTETALKIKRELVE